MPWNCFMVYATDEVELSLRRYRSSSEGGECRQNEMGYHDASVSIGRSKARWRKNEVSQAAYLDVYPVKEYAENLRWPTHCVCGYLFQDTDHSQVNPDLIYEDKHGKQWSQKSLPPGAMFEIEWIDMKGPDGKCLAVVLPPARPRHLIDVWIIDSLSSSGGRWTRTGVPPNLTVQPSIKSDMYHGFLQNGQLTDSLGDCPLPPGPDR